MYVSRVHDSFKCHGNVTKQIKPLQVDYLITYKYMSILEGSGKILNTRVKISVVAYVKNF